MNCEDFARADTLERYHAGLLDEAAMEQWEQHCFGCSHCFADWQSFQSIQTELAAAAPAIRQQEVEAARRLSWRFWVGAAATSLATAVVLVFWLAPVRTALAPAQPPAVVTQHAPFAELAKVEPPAYRPIVLRGSSTEHRTQYAQAMKFYERSEYSAAAAALGPVAAAAPELPEARFFLGASQLLAGDGKAAIASLLPVAEGDSSWQEEARWYLAKAYLKQGSLLQARQVLVQITGARGEFAGRAQHLIDSLPVP